MYFSFDDIDQFFRMEIFDFDDYYRSSAADDSAATKQNNSSTQWRDVLVCLSDRKCCLQLQHRIFTRISTPNCGVVVDRCRALVLLPALYLIDIFLNEEKDNAF